MDSRQQRSGARRLGYYAIGSLLVAISFLAAAELVTRTVSWASGKGFTLALHELDPYDREITDIYEWHPFTGFVFKTNNVIEGSHRRQQGRSHLLVDRHGFLAMDRGLDVQKPHNEIRIATIGASTTANLNLSFEENWPGRLGALVQQALPDTSVRVINAGVPGFDTAQSIANLALRVIPFRPDVVVIYHGYNDLKAIRPEAPFAADYAHIHRRPYGYHDRPPVLVRGLNHSMFYVRLRNRYRELAHATALRDSFREGGRLVEIPLAAEQAFEQHMRTLVAIARAGGASVVLSSFATLHDPEQDYGEPETLARLTPLQGEELNYLVRFTPGLTLPGVFDGIRRYNAVLQRVAREDGTGWVDNAARIPHTDEYFVDRVHFSRAGAELMAQNLLSVVLAQLRARPGKAAR